jgi:signal transduction histidine kinase
MRLNLQHLQRTLAEGAIGSEEKRAKIIEVLLAQINKLTRLADDFGSFARITESNPELLEPYEIVEQVVLLYDKEPEVQIHNKTTQVGRSIKMDKIAFERVLNNVFKNAVQAMNSEGTITITDQIRGRNYALLIADTGKGIDNELKDKIFSPNFSTKTSGMGIGLALSKRIIENANGQISFESEVGKGTTFTILIPLHS